MHCSCVLIGNKKAFYLPHVGSGKWTVLFFSRFHRPHINKCFDFLSVPHTFFWSLSNSLWSNLFKCFLLRGEKVTFPRDFMCALTITFLQWKVFPLCIRRRSRYWLESNFHPLSAVTSEIPTRNPVLEAVGWQQCLSHMIILWRSCLYHILNRAGWEDPINECFSYLLVYL